MLIRFSALAIFFCLCPQGFAWEILEKEHVDLVVSDIRMPGGDGLRLLDRIRARHPDLPQLIFITGYSDTSVSDCLARGAREVISKPFDRKIFLQAIYSALKIEMAA